MKQPYIQTTFPVTRGSKRMTARARRALGVLNLVVGALSLAAVIALYGLSEQLVIEQERAGGTLAVRSLLPSWGPELPVTLSTSLLLLGAAAGAVGSAIQQSILFALRAGYGRLEQGFVWWYVLRPVWSALLGCVVVAAVSTGLVSIGDATTSTAGVSVLAVAGTLAGLFTDRILQRLQNLLGATEPDMPAKPTKKEPQPLAKRRGPRKLDAA